MPGVSTVCVPRVAFHVQRQTLSPHDVKRGRPPDAEKLTKKGPKRNRLRARNLMMISGWSGSSPHPTREGRTDGWVSGDRKSTRLNSSHVKISYAVFCLKKKTDKRKRRH